MKKTVLIVEDDAGIQEILESILVEEGYEVVRAWDGVDALEKLARTMPQLILLDLMMPRMDGYAFADELRRRGLRGTIPIIVLTADGRVRQKADQLGVDGYLGKPFCLPALLDEVDRVSHLHMVGTA